MEQDTSKKIFHICMILAIIVGILVIVAILSIRYHVKGETNLPFEISKIAIISSVDGKDNEDKENLWSINVSQNNDIFIYLDKNNNYTETEVIDSIIIDNISIKKEVEKGETHLYKPATSEKELFQNTEENQVTELTFVGDTQSNIKELKIANQGDLIRFRYAIDGIATYTSGEGEQVDFSKLLQLTNISMEDLKSTITFDLTIKLKSGKQYKANVTFEVPIEGVIEEGKASYEITDNIIFKRIENN